MGPVGGGGVQPGRSVGGGRIPPAMKLQEDVLGHVLRLRKVAEDAGGYGNHAWVFAREERVEGVTRSRTAGWASEPVLTGVGAA